jgi:hypothetical protein
VRDQGLPVLEEPLGNKCNGVLELWLGRECLPDIVQEENLGSVNCDSLHHPDVEEFQPEERNVQVLRAGSVVGAAGERVQTTHEVAGLVEQGKVEPRQVYRDHLACHQFSFCDFWKYSKFL